MDNQPAHTRVDSPYGVRRLTTLETDALRLPSSRFFKPTQYPTAKYPVFHGANRLHWPARATEREGRTYDAGRTQSACYAEGRNTADSARHSYRFATWVSPIPNHQGRYIFTFDWLQNAHQSKPNTPLPQHLNTSTPSTPQHLKARGHQLCTGTPPQTSLTTRAEST